MPVLSCYVDDRTLHILQREAESRGNGETPERLAEAAIENAAIAALPGGYAGGQQHFALERGEPYGRPSDLRPGFFEDDMP